jgi:hypothetical protein
VPSEKVGIRNQQNHKEWKEEKY